VKNKNYLVQLMVMDGSQRFFCGESVVERVLRLAGFSEAPVAADRKDGPCGP
jgi:hypothetical protein